MIELNEFYIIKISLISFNNSNNFKNEFNELNLIKMLISVFIFFQLNFLSHLKSFAPQLIQYSLLVVNN